jgi:hypothetical protein
MHQVCCIPDIHFACLAKYMVCRKASSENHASTRQAVRTRQGSQPARTTAPFAATLTSAKGTRNKKILYTYIVQANYNSF